MALLNYCSFFLIFNFSNQRRNDFLLLGSGCIFGFGILALFLFRFCFSHPVFTVSFFHFCFFLLANKIKKNIVNIVKVGFSIYYWRSEGGEKKKVENTKVRRHFFFF